MMQMHITAVYATAICRRTAKTRRLATANRSRVSIRGQTLKNFIFLTQFDHHAKFGCCFSYDVRFRIRSENFGGTLGPVS